MKKFKEFLSESKNEFIIQTTNIFYKANAKNVIIDDLNLSNSSDLKGSYIQIVEYGVKSNPGKNLTKEIHDQIEKASKNSEYEIVYAKWISPKGQNWEGKIYQLGGALEVIIKIS